MLSFAVPLKNAFQKNAPWLVPASSTRRSAGDYLRILGTFLKISYVDGLRAILFGRFTRRQATFVIVAIVPLLLTVFMLTVPSFLFQTERHNAYYYFARILSSEPASLIPFLLGALSATVGLRLPLK